MMSCYYPTTTVAIDDDTDFLGILTQHLGIRDCIAYSSPNKAIKSIKNQNPFDRIQSRIVKKTSNAAEDISSCPEDYAVLINMHRLHEEIYNKDRFCDVSVLIVDYHMNELNGIDVCEALATHPAKKILLTGGADKEKVAIEAFNKGIIHRFINKSDPNFPSKLKQAIALLKDAYFRELSLRLLPHMPAASFGTLQNPAYINFINNQQAQFNSVEYYLLDATGSMLFVDTNGTPVWFIVKNETEIINYIKIAEDQDANQELIQTLANRKMIPFFFTEDDYHNSVSEWNNFLYQAHLLPGLSGHYYANNKGHIRNNLIRQNIFSYDAYQKINGKHYESQI